MGQQLRHCIHQSHINQRLIALHVDYDCIVSQAQQAARLSQSVAAAGVVARGHDSSNIKESALVNDFLAVSGNHHAFSLAELGALGNPHHHGCTTQVSQGFVE
jgi:hypothetical protein